MNHNVVGQKLQGVGFSKAEVDAMFALQRPLHDITRFSVQASVWCRRERMILWDVGNFHGSHTAASLLNKVSQLID